MSLPSLLLANINQGASIGPAPTLPTKDLSIGHFKDEQILCLAIYLEAFESTMDMFSIFFGRKFKLP